MARLRFYYKTSDIGDIELTNGIKKAKINAFIKPVIDGLVSKIISKLCLNFPAIIFKRIIENIKPKIRDGMIKKKAYVIIN